MAIRISKELKALFTQRLIKRKGILKQEIESTLMKQYSKEMRAHHKIRDTLAKERIAYEAQGIRIDDMSRAVEVNRRKIEKAIHTETGMNVYVGPSSSKAPTNLQLNRSVHILDIPSVLSEFIVRLQYDKEDLDIDGMLKKLDTFSVE